MAATLGPWLAAHMDVNAIDLAGAPAAEPDWTADPGLTGMRAFVEAKTVWHPIGV